MNWYINKKIAMPFFEAYHGSPKADSIYDSGFSFSYLGKGNEAYGPGFYFSDNKDLAKNYSGSDIGSGVIKAKINLNNPISISGGANSISDQFPSLSYDQTRSILLRSLSLFGEERLSDWGDVEFEGKENIIRKIIESNANVSFMHLLYDFFQQDMEQGLRAISNETGYDGVIVNFENGTRFVIAWFPEQIEVASQDISHE